jgi:4a-hydroxytetrahydrobiopterin dehydratase
VPDGWASRWCPRARFVFDDFAGSIAFVNRVAELAESENHHPDIAISYNRVTLRWWTHTAGSVTDRDTNSPSAPASSSCATRAVAAPRPRRHRDVSRGARRSADDAAAMISATARRDDVLDRQADCAGHEKGGAPSLAIRWSSVLRSSPWQVTAGDDRAP